MAKTTRTTKEVKTSKTKSSVKDFEDNKTLNDSLSKCLNNSDIWKLKEELIEITNEMQGKEIEQAREYISRIERKKSFEDNYTNATMAIAVINFC